MIDLIQLVSDHARTIGDHEAVLVVPDRAGGAADRLTYAQLDEAARRIGAALQDRLERGARVLLCHPTGTEFVRAFFGCLYSGMVPVPAPLPVGRGAGHLTRLRATADACGAELILTDTEHVEPMRAMGIAAETAPRGDAAGWRPVRPSPEDLAFLQFTSGSTSDPRGVRVTYGALLANLELMRSHYALPDGVRIGGWLPLYHDMGLVGTLLVPLRCGGRSTLLSSTAFLRDPYRWLEMIDTENVFMSPAPNFAYDLCVRRITRDRAANLDLSRWKAALNGAEPVRAATLDAFAERFAPAGFRPEYFGSCYGMAEVALFVTGTPIGQAPVITHVSPAGLERGEFVPDGTGVPMVSCGPLHDRFAVRVVDPGTGRDSGDGRIGEVRLAGESVAAGYWGRPHDPAFGDMLSTGDLGTVHDGQLYLTGRLKELIIIRGRNFYPNDLEAVLGSLHPAFESGLSAAFSVPVGGVEHLVAVQEIGADESGCPDAAELTVLAKQARAGLADHAGVALAGVCLVRRGAIRRSTSGKIRRVHMREVFQRGTLDALCEDLDPALRREYRAGPS
jgi:acyl-CoA synthetase (AMP-forming)/AMP-acid ligase II